MSIQSQSDQYKPIKPRHLWIPKYLLQAQGFYKGNRYIWIPKGPIRRTHVQPQVFKSAPLTLKGKEPMISPPSSPATKPIPNNLGAKSMGINEGSSSTTSWDQDATDNMILIFPPPNQQKLNPQKSVSEEHTPSLTPSSRILQLSQAAEILKRHIPKPQWWVNRFVRNPPCEGRMRGESVAHTSDHPISVFLAEAEPEEDLLQAFQHWIPYKEEEAQKEAERVEYEHIFFQQFWPQLPKELRNKVRVMVFTAQYHQRHPFGAANAPQTFQRILASVLECYKDRQGRRI